MSDTSGKGYWLPDAQLAEVRGYARRRNFASSNVYANKILDAYSHAIFSYDQDFASFDAAGDNLDLVNWFRREFIHGWPGRGNMTIHSLADLFRSIVYSLCVDGEGFYAIDLAGDASGFWALSPPRHMATETVQPVGRRSNIRGFVQQYSAHAEDERVRGVRFNFSRDEVLWVRWPATLPPGRTGKSPITAVLKEASRAEGFYGWMMRSAYSSAHPEDGRFTSDLVRYQKFETKKVEHQRRMARSFALAGVPQAYWFDDRETTEYFRVWEWCTFAERVSLLRQYLVAQFNEQVLKTWSHRNGAASPTRLVTVGYLAPEDWRAAFVDYENGRRTADQIVRMALDGRDQADGQD